VTKDFTRLAILSSPGNRPAREIEGIWRSPPYKEGMSDHEHAAGEWRLPERSRPPLLGELVGRIDEALATARASEAAVMTVGAAALDAAEQAKRAADLAERASAAMHRNPPVPSPTGRRDTGAMDDFSARADRVAERLSRLQRLPLPA
jgi:hypothetical protein